MSRTFPISEVKARPPELVTGVEEREEEVVVTRKAKPEVGLSLIRFPSSPTPTAGSTRPARVLP